MSYVLATADDGDVRTGGALGFNGDTWSKVEEKLPSTADHDDGGSSLTVDFNMGPGEEKGDSDYSAKDRSENGRRQSGGKTEVSLWNGCSHYESVWETVQSYFFSILPNRRTIWAC